MGICGWVIFGFFAGLVARLLMPGTQTMGFLKTTALGVVGSFVGGAVWALIRGHALMVLEPSSFIGSVLGALLLLWVGAFTGRK